MKLYFCWEATSKPKPMPVMYHGNPPAKSINGGGGTRIVSGPHKLNPVEAAMIFSGQCFPRWLTEKYPPPKEATT
jgi:hypothetical protein